ncbi:MAG: hypothetical protein HY592_05025 [Candidatus Omnitrophica bacterium]|nr:hypothetical protein [Candidatus Omnitrophota bacterium]
MASLPDAKKKQVKKAIRLTTAFFETGHLPHGLGLTPLGRQIWEIRAGLNERILFRKNEDVVEFLLIGSHDEIRRFLKNL